jgi:signal transduction histidine kinase
MTWWRAIDREGGSLIRRFAVLSFVVIGATTAALSFVLASALERDMLAREWQVTATFVRLLATDRLTATDFARPNDAAAQARFREFSDDIRRMPETIHVKVFDRAMTIVWTDDARLAGARFADNAQLIRAVAGETVAHLESKPTKTESRYEARTVVELYVPIELPGQVGVAGVAEVYKTPEAVFANVERGRRIVVGTSLVGGVLLWASLFGIVRAASRRIERQHRDLQRQSRELTTANAELLRVQGQLVATERLAAVGEVVAAVAHGIRNPLANVRASAQLALLDCRTCGPKAAAVDNISNAISEVDRLGARVSDLLRFVRPAERGADRLDLNDVVSETLRLMKERLAGGNVRLVERLDVGVPPIVGDFALLEQALGALVENALDAMNGEGTLTVTTGVDPDGLRPFVEITDTGPGIPASRLDDVFTLFYTTKARGTGLGLALAKKFVEGYGGTLTVTSRPGEGATFRATFPAREG